VDNEAPPQSRSSGRIPLNLRTPAPYKAEREVQWLRDNAETIKAKNAWVEKHGLPLARYRMF
jgi:Post-segregation antitoxin CcdA